MDVQLSAPIAVQAATGAAIPVNGNGWPLTALDVMRR